MIRPIYVYGHAVLRKKATDIKQDGSVDVKELANDMFETMYSASGVGLAGPQIGLGKRIFVVDGGAMDKELAEFKKVFINAEILEEEGDEWSFEEGCLSIPQIRGDVSRKSTIRIKYFDENWQQHEETFDGIAARIIQHEYDHIEGILFTDYLSPLRKRLLKGKLEKISKGKIGADYRTMLPKK